MNARSALALVALVLLLGVMTVLGNVQPELLPVGSARSNNPRGRLAAFQLLERLGFETELFNGSAGELMEQVNDDRGRGRPSGALLLPRVPRGFDPTDDPNDPLVRARAGGQTAWRLYREFAEGGGTLMLSATDGAADFLTQGLGLLDAGTEPIRLDAEPDCSAPFEQRWHPTHGVDELFDAAEILVARRIPLAEGSILLIPRGLDWVENDPLRAEANALFLVRLVELALGPDGGPVRFHEAALYDRQEGGSPLSIAFGKGRFVSWHLIAFAALLLWMLGWVREFPRDPAPHDALSPLLRTAATASLLERNERYGALAEMLRSALFAQLGGPKFGGPKFAGPRPEETPSQVRSSVDIAALARKRGREREADRWIELFSTRPVGDLEALVTLDRDLRTLEVETTRRSPANRTPS